MAGGLNSKQKMAIKAAFQKYDTDGDGHVSAEELVKAMGDMGRVISIDCAMKMIAANDSDGSKTLELDEFETMLEKKTKISKESQIKEAFKKLDPDGNGNITKEQLRQVIKKQVQMSSVELSEEEMDELISEADTNADGLIDYEEFLKMMTINVE